MDESHATSRGDGLGRRPEGTRLGPTARQAGSEVPAKAQRRRFTAEYRLGILRAGLASSLLRPYSSHFELATHREQGDPCGTCKAVRRPGSRPIDPRVKQLEADNRASGSCSGPRRSSCCRADPPETPRHRRDRRARRGRHGEGRDVGVVSEHRRVPRVSAPHAVPARAGPCRTAGRPRHVAQRAVCRSIARRSPRRCLRSRPTSAPRARCIGCSPIAGEVRERRVRCCSAYGKSS